MMIYSLYFLNIIELICLILAINLKFFSNFDISKIYLASQIHFIHIYPITFLEIALKWTFFTLWNCPWNATRGFESLFCQK